MLLQGGQDGEEGVYCGALRHVGGWEEGERENGGFEMRVVEAEDRDAYSVGRYAALRVLG
jgi:hypothetical protein